MIGPTPPLFGLGWFPRRLANLPKPFTLRRFMVWLTILAWLPPLGLGVAYGGANLFAPLCSPWTAQTTFPCVVLAIVLAVPFIGGWFGIFLSVVAAPATLLAWIVVGLVALYKRAVGPRAG